jgi:hypothetical protein
MASYKWGVEHKVSQDDIVTILLDFGFEEVEEAASYTILVNEWKPLVAKVKTGVIDFVFHWMGEATTEIYYDYLLASGVLIGQVMRVIDDTPFLEGDSLESTEDGF